MGMSGMYGLADEPESVATIHAALDAGITLLDTGDYYVAGQLPKLAVSGDDSAGERVQRLLPETHVVQAFNTVGNPFMFRPSFPGGPPDMFICGNTDEAKKKVAS